MNKPRNYRNNNSSERIATAKVANPIRLIDGKMVEVDAKSGDPIRVLK